MPVHWATTAAMSSSVTWSFTILGWPGCSSACSAAASSRSIAGISP